MKDTNSETNEITKIEFYNSTDTNIADFGYDASTKFKLRTYGSRDLWLQPDGDLYTDADFGIGDSTPDAALDVVGDIIATENITATKGFRLPTSQPNSPVAGDLYFNTANETLACYTGSLWRYYQFS